MLYLAVWPSGCRVGALAIASSGESRVCMIHPTYLSTVCGVGLYTELSSLPSFPAFADLLSLHCTFFNDQTGICKACAQLATHWGGGGVCWSIFEVKVKQSMRRDWVCSARNVVAHLITGGKMPVLWQWPRTLFSLWLLSPELEPTQPCRESYTAKLTSSSCSKWRVTMMRDSDVNNTRQSGRRRVKLKISRILNIYLHYREVLL